MPLSEHEERILAEIERQLAAEDPRFVARTRRRRGGWSRSTRVRLAIALAVVGLASLLSLIFHIAFGVVGLVLLLASILLGVSAFTHKPDPPQSAVPPDEGS